MRCVADVLSRRHLCFDLAECVAEAGEPYVAVVYPTVIRVEAWCGCPEWVAQFHESAPYLVVFAR